MADERPVSPIRPEESATTREEMDFDDEPATVSPAGTKCAPAAAAPSPSPKPRVQFSAAEDEEIPPSKPPRPVDPMQQAEGTLIEAFPSIDPKVVKAVLVASGGQVEPAFNALLGMSDPDFAPPQPPRPQPRAALSQMEADEAYARRLAAQYDDGGRRAQTRYNQREPGRRGPNQQQRDDYDREPSFFDDELPEIGRNIQQGFLETQKKVNSWISNFKKRLDGEPEDDEDLYAGSAPPARPPPGRQNFGASQAEQLQGIRRMEPGGPRRSTEAQRYDADPHEFGEDEFERLELRDDEAPPPQPPRTSSRQPANPNLFKSHPPLPPQTGPVDEVEAADGGKSKKWQPLTSAAPYPEDDNDPFSLGDDDDDNKDEKKPDAEVRKDDAERLKTAAAEKADAQAEGEGEEGQALEENATSAEGVKDQTTQEILAGAEKEKSESKKGGKKGGKK